MCAVLIAILLSGGCRQKEQKNTRSRMVPVTTELSLQKNVPVRLTAVGNVKPITTVSVRAQVGGVLQKVHFNEGEFVQKGETLFTIDPQPFETALRLARATLQRDRAQLDQARANIDRDEALVKQARANLNRDMALANQARANFEKDSVNAQNATDQAKRYRSLLEKGFTTQEQYDTLKTNADAYQATLRASRQAIAHGEALVESSKASLEQALANSKFSRAAVENAQAGVLMSQEAVRRAQIDLSYCTIRSPQHGRTGSLIVNEGNVVRANDTTALVTINQIKPIYVEFSVPERYLSDIKKRLLMGRLTLEATSSQDKNMKEEGVVTFVDNTVDSTTGTISLRGTFANTSRSLWPGLYVDVSILISEIKNAVVVPSQAVQTGQKGRYVFIVKPDKTAELRVVKTGITVNDETVIEDGLKAGEIVVTDGHLRLTEGSPVEVMGSRSADEKVKR
jgi:membrane fusion protein, multidrug efflux system